jgi:hypothetical protein
MTVGRCLFFCLDTKEPKDQNWFLGNYSAALRNVRFFLKVILEGLEHVVLYSLVLDGLWCVVAHYF